MAVRFYTQEVSLQLKNKTRLKNFLGKLFKEEGTPLKELQYIFCTDVFLLQINREFLHHDTYTDIITFDLSENSLERSGEIYISIERVKENAVRFGEGFIRELHRVIFHGALHLCGYKDKSGEDRRIMREKENLYLEKYFGSLKGFT